MMMNATKPPSKVSQVRDGRSALPTTRDLGAMQARCTVLQMEIIVNYSLGFILLTLIVIITISTALAQALARTA